MDASAAAAAGNPGAEMDAGVAEQKSEYSAIQAVSSDVEPTAKYDLTHTMSPFMDPHMMFPLLQFLEEKELYKRNDLLKAKIELLGSTYLYDFAIESYCELHQVESGPAHLTRDRNLLLDQLGQLKEEVLPLLNIIDEPEQGPQLIENGLFNMTYLGDTFDISADMVEQLYFFAKEMFDAGQYEAASTYLHHYRLLVGPSTTRSFWALWGMFACEILYMQLGEYEKALGLLNELREAIDSQPMSHLEQLQQRTWLIHWSLFVFFNSFEECRDNMIDLFLSEKYLNAIQTNCPWILRYLAVAVICHKRRRNLLKDMVKVIRQERYTYQDPITKFLESLFVKFDFEGAQELLKECERVIVSDFFLVYCHEEFAENARLFIFETYCRIHQKIDISMLATKLAMPHEAAERWIVDLIRNAHLDAKINSEKSYVVMGTQYPDVYQQVMEKTKDLAVRTHVLSNNILRDG